MPHTPRCNQTGGRLHKYTQRFQRRLLIRPGEAKILMRRAAQLDPVLIQLEAAEVQTRQCGLIGDDSPPVKIVAAFDSYLADEIAGIALPVEF
jgi:hypothetical protein